jgi:N-acetylneuraminic acid mutarotase
MPPLNKTVRFLFMCFVFAAKAQTSWHQLPNYPGLGRVKPATFTIGHYFYVCCGNANQSPSSATSDCWKWDDHTQTWSPIASYPGGGSYAPGGFSYQNFGFLVCGWDGSAETNDMWRYDTNTNTWTQMANFPGVARDNVFAFVVGSKAYVGCGSINSPPYLQDIYEYDIIANTWTPRNNFPVDKAGEVYKLIGNSGYVGTGGPGAALVNDFWKYNPVTDNWTAMAPVPTAGNGLDHAAMFSVNGKGYAVTGLDGTWTITKHAYMYDTLTNTWCQIQDLTGSARYYSAEAGSIGKKGLLLCGISPTSSLLDDFWEYLPMAGFKETDTTVCSGTPVNFIDTSDFSPTSWQWKFQNGTPATSNSQNPSIIFNSSGNDTIELIVGNSCMVDTVIKVVHITDSSFTHSVKGNFPICSAGSDTLVATGGGTYLWSTGATTSSIIVNPATNTVYTVHISNGPCSMDTSVLVISSAILTALITGPDSVCVGSFDTLVASGGVNYLWSNGATTSSIVVNPVSNTTYSVHVTSPPCFADTTFSIAVLPYPTLNFSCTTTNMCQGDSLVLTASGGLSLRWSTGSTSSAITVKPLTTTTYSVKIFNGGECYRDTSVTIQVNAVPIATTGTVPPVCAGQQVQLKASGGQSYQWLPSSGLTCSTCDTTSANPLSNTTYTVVVSNGNCHDTAYETVAVTPLPNGTVCCPQPYPTVIP